MQAKKVKFKKSSEESMTDFKPGEFVLIAVMLLAQLVSFFVSKDFPCRNL